MAGLLVYVHHDDGEFSPQGAISVPALVPLPNRGSYGQVVATMGATGHP